MRLIGLALSLLLLPLIAAAQQTTRVHRIGYLGVQTPAFAARSVKELQIGLRDLGYLEGKNFVIEARWAEGRYERLPHLATDLVRAKVDVIVTGGTPAIRAAKQATTTIPIVMTGSGDAVASGLVASLARPGGNVTGSTFFVPELMAKRLELLREAMPRAVRVAVLVNADDPSHIPVLAAMESTARSVKFALQKFALREPSDFDKVFLSMVKERMDAVVVEEDSLLQTHAVRIAETATKNRLPLVGNTVFARGGAQIGYGVDQLALVRRAAYFVDKILKGTKPADLPVEQPTKFELVINLKTAKALGLTIPQTLLLRADEVIQ
jgi:ABC-type uncharacterized transport system substrate-binding protein